MRANEKVFFLILIAIPAAVPKNASSAQVGTTGASFLTLGAGPRAVAMGEAFVGVADDSYASYWNPAGLGLVNRTQVAFMYNRSFADTAQTHFNAAVPFQRGGTIGGYFTRLSVKPFSSF